jgi:pyruvate formate lyase activating enzyme
MEGRIFKIRRFSVLDGPGIRTSVFLKGCPLNCIWCHSPEGISSEFSVWHDNNLCISCGECVKACMNKALRLTASKNSAILISRDLCTNNGDCINVCPTGAMQFNGSVAGVKDILTEIEKDLLYYIVSGGGVTLTGGEPLYQPDFSLEILKECRVRNIHTAIETSLFCERETLKAIYDYVDLFIADVKIFDPELHLRFTGRSNEIILDNFRFLAESANNIIVRIPMIKDITDTEENKNAIRKFVNNIDDRIIVEYIPYNPLAENNYKRMGIPFLLRN